MISSARCLSVICRFRSGGGATDPAQADKIVQTGEQVDDRGGQKEHTEAGQAPGRGREPEGSIEKLPSLAKIARLTEEGFPSPSFVVVQNRGGQMMPMRRFWGCGSRVGGAGSDRWTGAKDELICRCFGIATDERERV